MGRKNRRKATGQPNSDPSDQSDQDPTDLSDLGDPTDQKNQTDQSDQKDPKPTIELPSLSRVISVIMLLLGILVVGLLFYQVMVGFFVPLFLAAALVVIFRPVHEWIYHRVGQRPRVAAVATTSLVLMLVLIPFVLVVSIAWSQITTLSKRADEIDRLTNRAREQFGLTLPHADRFRRLDELSESFDDIEHPDKVLKEIEEAKVLLSYLQTEVEGSPVADPSAVDADKQLNDFKTVVTESQKAIEANDQLEKIRTEEEFHRESLETTALIHKWMSEKLGGPVWAQMKLFANPSQSQTTNLFRTARTQLQPRFVKLTGDTSMLAIQIVVGLLIMVISVYFFLVDGPAMVRTLMRLSPLDDNYERQLLGEFERTSRAVVMASILSAIVQGILAAIAFYICGLESIMFLFLVTTVMALVPFLGAASVWVPCVIYLGVVQERWGWAIFLAIYGVALISSIDNVIKAYVLHGHSELHPLLALLSVLGGVAVFGPVGLLVGPMVVVFLQTLLEILAHELTEDDSDAETAAEP